MLAFHWNLLCSPSLPPTKRARCLARDPVWLCGVAGTGHNWSELAQRLQPHWVLLPSNQQSREIACYLWVDFSCTLKLLCIDTLSEMDCHINPLSQDWDLEHVQLGWWPSRLGPEGQWLFLFLIFSSQPPSWALSLCVTVLKSTQKLTAACEVPCSVVFSEYGNGRSGPVGGEQKSDVV